jgi:hypothetical protein
MDEQITSEAEGDEHEPIDVGLHLVDTSGIGTLANARAAFDFLNEFMKVDSESSENLSYGRWLVFSTITRALDRAAQQLDEEHAEYRKDRELLKRLRKEVSHG